MDTTKYVVTEEVATQEVKEFVEYHTDKPTTTDKVATEYPQVISSVMRGILDITNPDKPVLTLREPLKGEDGDVVAAKVEFKTRILNKTYQELAKGIDMQKDSFKFAGLITAHVCGFDSAALLDKLPNKHDYKTIQQLSGLFI